MNRSGPKERESVLVTWIAVGAGPRPIVEALADPESLLFGQVGQVFLCYRDAPDGDKERKVLAETEAELRTTLGANCPAVRRQPWVTNTAPTDHSAILGFAEKTLLGIRRENPCAPIFVHTSPGTPAMHAVWLVLGATDSIEGPLHLIQGTSRRDRKPGQPPVHGVNLELDTWLRRYRRQRPIGASATDDGRLWDPTRAKSPALLAVLERIAKWAPLRVPILLLGERGTGKTTLAGLIRSRSPFQGTGRGGWPTAVCGQFRANPELARSELFGLR